MEDGLCMQLARALASQDEARMSWAYGELASLHERPSRVVLLTMVANYYRTSHTVWDSVYATPTSWKTSIARHLEAIEEEIGRSRFVSEAREGVESFESTELDAFSGARLLDGLSQLDLPEMPAVFLRLIRNDDFIESLSRVEGNLTPSLAGWISRSGVDLDAETIDELLDVLVERNALGVDGVNDLGPALAQELGSFFRASRTMGSSPRFHPLFPRYRSVVIEGLRRKRPFREEVFAHLFSNEDAAGLRGVAEIARRYLGSDDPSVSDRLRDTVIDLIEIVLAEGDIAETYDLPR
jgi:hypothetical protein